MANEDLIREIAVKVCIEVLREKSRELAEDVARRMGAALASHPSPRGRDMELRDGTVLIAGARTQTEILEALLTASSAITPACGLMILRGAQATGWSCIGLIPLDKFKRATMDCTRGVAAKVISSSTASIAKVSEIDPAFAARLALPAGAKTSATARAVEGEGGCTVDRSVRASRRPGGAGTAGTGRTALLGFAGLSQGSAAACRRAAARGRATGARARTGARASGGKPRQLGRAACGAARTGARRGHSAARSGAGRSCGSAGGRGCGCRTGHP